MLGAGTTVSFARFYIDNQLGIRGGNVMYSDLGRQMTFTGSGKWTENRAPHIFPNSAYLDAASGKYVPNTTIMTREAEYGLWADTYRLMRKLYCSGMVHQNERYQSFLPVL